MKLEKSREISFPTGVLGLASTADGTRLYAACIDCNIEKSTVSTRAARGWHGRRKAPSLGTVELRPKGPRQWQEGFSARRLGRWAGRGAW